MLAYIKRNLPDFIKSPLVKIKLKTVDRIRKRLFARKMQAKHEKWVGELKGKEKIKVLFLAMHESIWKVDTVFKEMLDDPYFDPEILVCPYLQYGKERMLDDMNQAYEFFEKKGYPVKKSRKDSDGTWVKLSEISPDIIFFTNPHDLTLPEYYSKSYKSYLSCYVPYFYLVTTHDGDVSIYDQEFHNALWRHYLPHAASFSDSKRTISGSSDSSKLVGYPAAEQLLIKRAEKKVKCVWKKQGEIKKKIIFAPHHTIENNGFQLSNFLSYAEEFVKLARNRSSEVQWAFKPHPILKSKLYLHSDWGELKTNEYYDFWKYSPNTQLELGEYGDLFAQSDAMIHDSGSFLAEYLLLRKPVLYLLKNTNERVYLNEFGRLALDACCHGYSMSEIEDFVSDVCNDNLTSARNKIDQFLQSQVMPFKSPSKNIINDIKVLITG